MQYSFSDILVFVAVPEPRCYLMLEWCISETRPIFIIKIVNKWRNICHFSTYITSVGSVLTRLILYTFPFIRRWSFLSSSPSSTDRHHHHHHLHWLVGMCARSVRSRFPFASWCFGCCFGCCKINITCFTFIPDSHSQRYAFFIFGSGFSFFFHFGLFSLEIYK